jgi:hypothetical protein
VVFNLKGATAILPSRLSNKDGKQAQAD